MGGRGNNYFAQIRRVLVNNDKAIRKARKGNTTSVVYREMKPYRQDRFRFRSVPAVIYVFFVFLAKSSYRPYTIIWIWQTRRYINSAFFVKQHFQGYCTEEYVANVSV